MQGGGRDQHHSWAGLGQWVGRSRAEAVWKPGGKPAAGAWVQALQGRQGVARSRPGAGAPTRFLKEEHSRSGPAAEGVGLHQAGSRDRRRGPGWRPRMGCRGGQGQGVAGLIPGASGAGAQAGSWERRVGVGPGAGSLGLCFPPLLGSSPSRGSVGGRLGHVVHRTVEMTSDDT